MPIYHYQNDLLLFTWRLNDAHFPADDDTSEKDEPKVKVQWVSDPYNALKHEQLRVRLSFIRIWIRSEMFERIELPSLWIYELLDCISCLEGQRKNSIMRIMGIMNKMVHNTSFTPSSCLRFDAEYIMYINV